jgi:hypothetical protein
MLFYRNAADLLVAEYGNRLNVLTDQGVAQLMLHNWSGYDGNPFVDEVR